MKKMSFLILGIFLLVVVAIALSSFTNFTSSTTKTDKTKPIDQNEGKITYGSVNVPQAYNMTFPDGDYEAEWREINQLENEGLPKSALEKVEALEKKVRQDNNPAQLVKVIIYKNKYQSQLEEDGIVKAIARIQGEMEKAEFPVKPILKSMLADAYKQYLDNNRWKIKDRSTTTNFKQDDIQTWDVKKFNEQTTTLYLESLENEKSQQIALNEFKVLLRGFGQETPTYRPTLYDFLAHRALDHLMNSRTHLTKVADKFYIEHPEAFGTVPVFTTYQLTTTDKGNWKFLALKLFQELEIAHQNAQDPRTLLDVTLKRLRFVREHSILENKDELYETTLKALQKRFSNNEVYAEISYWIAKIYTNKGEKYKPSPTQAHKWDYKTAFDITANAINKYPNSFGAKQCRSLQAEIKRKKLNLTIEHVNVPNKAILASIGYRNVGEVYFKIVKITHKEIQNLKRSRNKILKALKQKAALKNWQIDLPDDGDYHNHITEVNLGKLPIGYYAVLMADNSAFESEKKAVAYAFINVSNIAFLSRQDETGARQFYVVDRTTGRPMEGVLAEFYEEKYNSSTRSYDYKKRNKALKSNAQGLIQTKFGRGYYKTKFTKGDDVLFLDDNYSSYKSRHRERVYEQTHFFLDRAIYRPGQTVYFKGLATKQISDEKVPQIIKNTAVTVTFYDANYQKVKSLDLKTNDYGTFHGSFVAPLGGLTGEMQLQSTIGSNRKYFRVEEYKRPKFEVQFEPVKESFKLGEEVTIKGTGKAYAGSVIDGAKVQYRVVRQVHFPYWSWWRWGWYNPYKRADMEIVNGVVETDDKGQFTVKFKAIPDKSIPKAQNPEFTYQIYADVTDITGETRSNSAFVKVGYIALNVSVNLPETINNKKIESFSISTLNLNGEFEAASGSVMVDKLATPDRIFINRYWERPDMHLMTQANFHSDFPHFAYKNEDNYTNWLAEKTVVATNFDTKSNKTIELKGIKSWKQGKYRMTLKTKDKYGTPVEIVKYFTLFDLGSKSAPLNDLNWNVVSQPIAQPSETVNIYLGSSEKRIDALYEVEHEGKILSSDWLKIKHRETVDLPIVEQYRGGVHYHMSFVRHNRVFVNSRTISVPWRNKDLKVEYATFRDKLLPGQEEEWQIKISGAKTDKVAAEMLAAMYDASLDAFAANTWETYFFGYDKRQRTLNANQNFKMVGATLIANGWQHYASMPSRSYPHLNWFRFSFYTRRYYRSRAAMSAPETYAAEEVIVGAAPPMPTKSARPRPKSKSSARKRVGGSFTEENLMVSKEEAEKPERQVAGNTEKPRQELQEDFGNVKVRTNLNETVFFFPQLQTNADGNIIIKFKMNEALTRWKFMGFAHTQSLEYAFTTKEVVTQKDLMVMPNAPRFFRENDEIHFTAKVSNLSEKDLKGTAILQLFDGVTMKAVDNELKNDNARIPFAVKKGLSAPLTWKLQIPDGGLGALTYRVIAKAGDFSDGEEDTKPVLTNRMLLVETQPLPVRGEQTKKFDFVAMRKASESKTLKHHQVTLEFTSNPAWYAIQSLPYLMEYPYECTEQVFSRYYANSLATSVANSHPKVKSVFDSWKAITPDALESNLSKNQELKYALLEETPWVLSAQSEAQQKKNIGVLFDLNRMSNELGQAMKKMKERQLSNGGFAWFPGGRDSWYITQYIVEGLGHLRRLGVNEKATGLQSERIGNMLQDAVRYTDARIVEQYDDLAKAVKKGHTKFEDDHLTYMAMHYLYTRTFFLDIPMESKTQKVFDYYIGQAEQYWLKRSLYMQGMLALSLHRKDRTAAAAKIIKSLKERSLNNDEMGMYWKYNTGYYWYQLPIETHALMIEVFDEVANDAQAVDDLKTWMLKNRQTNHWKTTKATAAAVYAMLLRGDNWLMEDQQVDIYFGGDKLDQSSFKKEAGTGYFKTKIDPTQISMIGSKMADIKVENPNKNPAWGALYWQYFEDLDQVKIFKDTPLKLDKQLFKEVMTKSGPVITPVTEKTKLTPGDKLKVRIELRVDRTMEYVHMKDARASGFEPINVFSRYKWQGGLGYYESTKDAATNFFFSYLPKGTYVFEYPLRVQHQGNFSNGVTTIQCMYAPEFTAHSEGIRVTVE